MISTLPLRSTRGFVRGLLVFFSLNVIRAICRVAVTIMLSGCAASRPHVEEDVVALSKKDTLNVYEATIRYRMRKFPLPRGSRCEVYIRMGALPALATRFPEYHMVVRPGWVGWVGGPVPQVRWYDLELGRTARNNVFVNEMDGQNKGVFIELRLENGNWRVVDETPAVLL
jgi:hypothetical protein